MPSATRQRKRTARQRISDTCEYLSTHMLALGQARASLAGMSSGQVRMAPSGTLGRPRRSVSLDGEPVDPNQLTICLDGTPVPGGLGFYQALDLVESAARGRCVKGIDVVELAPVAGQPVSDFTAALISYHLMRIALIS